MVIVLRLARCSSKRIASANVHRGALALAAIVLGSACALNSTQSSLAPAGAQAEQLEQLWWFAFWVAAVVYGLVVLAALVGAVVRRRAEYDSAVVQDANAERVWSRAVAGATAATIVILFVFLVVDLLASRSLGAMQQEPDALRVRITGFQWWWRVEYLDTIPSRHLVSANELHLPVGRSVELELQTGDVIHSFWVPALNGKRDLIPGQQNRLWLRATRPGTFRGECAEFCGQQHAKMALMVVVQSPAEFARWYEQQLASATVPADTTRARGLQAFLTNSCATCHQIRGTPAAGQAGPDLTHVGSRLTLAAGAIPNTRGHLGGWISNPQTIKPGTRMPPTVLSSGELQALLAYLEGLR